MGREIRKVPANWQHPKDENGRFVPLFGSSWSKAVAEWDEELAKWNEGLCRAYGDQEKWRPKDEDELKYTFEEWSGRRPEKDDYMPEWGESELTHIQLYETTSEGTPKSPVFAKGDFEKLCEYAAENCTTFATFKASKEDWVAMLSDGLVFHQSGNMIFI